MTAFLLDSTIIIDALNGRRGRDVLLQKLVVEGGILACCSVNVTEVFSGTRQHEILKTNELLSSFEYYDVNWDIAKRAGLIRNQYSRKGTTLSLADATIAAVALNYNLTLITDNARHFPMPDLSLYPAT